MRYDDEFPTPLRSSSWPPASPHRAGVFLEETACLHLDEKRWYDQLDSRSQAIVDMAYEGYSEEKMAEVLDISRGTVRRCRQAMAQGATWLRPREVG